MDGPGDDTITAKTEMVVADALDKSPRRNARDVGMSQETGRC